jgi:XisH protein
MAKDKIHDAVKNALIKDGWTITDDPFKIVYKKIKLAADLAAEKILAAERGTDRIVVEVKSFLGLSVIHELQQALGQYEVYRFYLKLTEPDRVLYLAVDDNVYAQFLGTDSVQPLLEETKMKLVIINLETEAVVQWIG